MRHVLVVLVLVACNDPKLVHISKCNSPCFTGPVRNRGVGTCSDGKWVCVGHNEDTAECVGSILPAYETCNGLDDDCDGRVDNYIKPIGCTTPCGVGFQHCTLGAWSECSAPKPQQETCNGKDDDCDGIIDNNISSAFCYDGPTGTAQFGDCHPGTIRCIFGQQQCVGEKLPTKEICDGVDNDCNGLIDDSSSINSSVDLVFIVDNSGSMLPHISNLHTAITQWVNVNASNTQFRWALVTAPDNDYLTWDTKVRLFMDFSTASDFVAALSQQGSNGSGSEPTLDAVYDVANSSNILGLSWANDRRVIVLLSDEIGQSYNYIPPITDADVLVSLRSGRPFPSVFIWTTVTDPMIVTGYQQLAYASGGAVYNINAMIPQMQLDLDALITAAQCGP